MPPDAVKMGPPMYSTPRTTRLAARKAREMAQEQLESESETSEGRSSNKTRNVAKPDGHESLAQSMPTASQGAEAASNGLRNVLSGRQEPSRDNELLPQEMELDDDQSEHSDSGYDETIPEFAQHCQHATTPSGRTILNNSSATAELARDLHVKLAALEYNAEMQGRDLFISDRLRTMVEGELTQTQGKLKRTEQENVELKRKVLDGNPIQDKTDAELAGRYTSIAHAIEHWVEAECNTNPRATVLLKKMDAEPYWHRSTEAFLDFHIFETMDFHEDAQLTFLKALIHHCIRRVFFWDSSIVVPIRISSVVEGMRTVVEKTQASEKVKSDWRATTYTIFSTHPSVMQEREALIQTLLHNLQNLLFLDLEPVIASVKMSKFKKTIAEPAMSLAIDTRCSPSIYKMFNIKYTSKYPVYDRIRVADIEDMEMIDARTECRATPSKKLFIEHQIGIRKATIGEAICTVFPGLNRVIPGNKARIRLCKPVVLVKFFEESQDKSLELGTSETSSFRSCEQTMMTIGEARRRLLHAADE